MLKRMARRINQWLINRGAEAALHAMKTEVAMYATTTMPKVEVEKESLTVVQATLFPYQYNRDGAMAYLNKGPKTRN